MTIMTFIMKLEKKLETVKPRDFKTNYTAYMDWHLDNRQVPPLSEVAFREQARALIATEQ